MKKRIEKINDVLGMDDDKVHDLGAFLSGGRKVVFERFHQLMRQGAAKKGSVALERYEAQHEATKQLMRDRRERELWFSPLFALGFTNKFWAENKEAVEAALDAYRDASPEMRTLMTWGREHLIEEIRELPFDDLEDILEANRLGS